MIKNQNQVEKKKKPELLKAGGLIRTSQGD